MAGLILDEKSGNYRIFFRYAGKAFHQSLSNTTAAQPRCSLSSTSASSTLARTPWGSLLDPHGVPVVTKFHTHHPLDPPEVGAGGVGTEAGSVVPLVGGTGYGTYTG